MRKVWQKSLQVGRKDKNISPRNKKKYNINDRRNYMNDKTKTNCTG